MFYVSTRGGGRPVTSAEAIKTGIAPDGGLFVPASQVRISLREMLKIMPEDYCGRAAAILSHYLTDYTAGEIDGCVRPAYRAPAFDHPETAPLKEIDELTSILELWHGPTSAFKDMALQIMPRLLPLAAAKTGEKAEIVILVATSGDTGKAALEGFRDVPGTRIMVFYPDRGVSEVQRLQMVTQEGANVSVVAVKGNFDDAQNGVKAIFANKSFNDELNKKGFRFSSANSINWGRLVPQIVYYFSAYLDLVRKGRLAAGDVVNFVVPTGNFGNILAGYYAREAGLPVNKLICAANVNNVLTDFVRTGAYDRNREFHKTISPSMDILVSSNLERLLFDLSGRDSIVVRDWMDGLAGSGRYDIGGARLEKLQKMFWSDYACDRETLQTIKETFDRYGYVVDTHTAVGINVCGKYRAATGDRTPAVILSTASPYKFSGSVVRTLLGEQAVAGRSEFDLLKKLAEVSGTEIPRNLQNLDKKPVLHSRVVEKQDMIKAVEEFLK